jgi:chemotaxis protein MotB
MSGRKSGFEHVATKSSNAWMVTFADLTALLLTFFVLLFSMSSVNIAEWDEVITALSKKLGENIEADDGNDGSDLAVLETFVPKAVDLEYLRNVLSNKLQSDPILSKAELQMKSDRMVISLPSDSLFKASSAELTEAALGAVSVLGDALLVIGNRVDVAGHTDPIPISTWAYPSNWELSLARAVSVASAFRNAGYTPGIAAIGYGDSRFGNLPRDITEKERYVLARRVDVIIRQGTGAAYAP